MQSFLTTLTCLAVNGAAIIHNPEFALQGAGSEYVGSAIVSPMIFEKSVAMPPATWPGPPS